MPGHQRSRDFFHAPQRHSVSLLDGKRMVRRFDLDERALAGIAQVQVSVEAEGLGINREVVAEPAENGRLASSDPMGYGEPGGLRPSGWRGTPAPSPGGGGATLLL